MAQVECGVRAFVNILAVSSISGKAVVAVTLKTTVGVCAVSIDVTVVKHFNALVNINTLKPIAVVAIVALTSVIS